MKNERVSIGVVKIGDKPFEESDVAIINIFPPTKEIGIGIATRNDGDAELWISKEECIELINRL